MKRFYYLKYLLKVQSFTLIQNFTTSHKVVLSYQVELSFFFFFFSSFSRLLSSGFIWAHRLVCPSSDNISNSVYPLSRSIFGGMAPCAGLWRQPSEPTCCTRTAMLQLSRTENKTKYRPTPTPNTTTPNTPPRSLLPSNR